MERELTVEVPRARLDIARQLGRKVIRMLLMTDSKDLSAKKLLANGVTPPRVAAQDFGGSGYNALLMDSCIE